MTARIAISGASGWLGRELIYFLLRNKQIDDLSEIELYSSRSKEIDFGEFGKAKSRSFLDANPREALGVESFIHLAFLTRDLETKYGQREFVRINNQLTNKAVEFILTLKPKNVVNVSSGAVFNRETRKFETNAKTNPYGFGKLLEEEKLLIACQDSGASLAIGRLWGCSGEFMPINKAYALSDLIFTAMTENAIRIKSKHRVWRKYCDSGQFMYLLYSISQHWNYKIIDSGGPLIEIGELAELISAELGGVEIHRELDLNAREDDYFPKSLEFEELAKRQGIALYSIMNQIKRTILGHQKAFSTLEFEK